MCAKHLSWMTVDHADYVIDRRVAEKLAVLMRGFV